MGTFLRTRAALSIALIPALWWASCAASSQAVEKGASLAQPEDRSDDAARIVLADPEDLGSRREGEDWPDFLGPRRNGVSIEKRLALDWNVKQPPVRWQCELGASYSAPTVSRGRLFHFDRFGDKHRLTCRRSETGDVLWTYEFAADYTDMLDYNNGPRATPVVDGPRVFVLAPEGPLHCVEVATGRLLWQLDTLKEFHVVKNFFGIGGTPLVWDDLLILNIGGSPPGSPSDIYTARGEVKGNGSGVVAFDKTTGAVRWRSTDELASYASPIVATIDQQQWLFVLARGGLLGLRPRDGKQEFAFPFRAKKLESVNASTPVAVGNEVFISEAYGPGGALLQVAPGACRPIWQDAERGRDQALALHWNTAVFSEGMLFASSGQHAGAAELRCVEWKTGEVRWREPGLGRSSLLLVDGRLVCLSEDGSVRLLTATAERYEELGKLTLTTPDGDPLLTYPAWAAPVLARGLLYLRGADRLVCVDLQPEG